MTAQQIINAALRKIRVISASQSASTSQESNALEALDVLLRSWSAEGLMVYYVEELEPFALTGAASYTIGDGGDFDTVRPVKILGAVVRSGGIDVPLDIVAQNRYLEIAQKSTGDTPAILWYNPVYPLADIYLWPVGSAGINIYLNSVKPLTEPTDITSSISFPPEYDRAMIFNLAVDLAPEFDKMVSPTLANMALQAKNNISNLYASLQVEEATVEILEIAGRYHIEAG